MATYIARDNEGNHVNTIAIEPEQVYYYEELTGLKLEPPVISEDVNGVEVMETALNELGVTTRE